MTDLDRIAADLLDAYDQGRLTGLPSASGAFSMADGYTVGERLTTLRRARGEQTVGRKIGFTNRSIWAEYGVDRPLWAHIYDDTLVDASAGHAPLSIGRMVAPRIEAEIVLGLSGPVDAQASPSALIRSIGWIALGFEIVDCHYHDWRFTIADCTADFGLHAALVVGAPRLVEPAEREALVDQLRDLSVSQRRGGELFAEGVGANALGSPLLALGFLAETIAALGGEPLAAGEVVTTGTLTPAVPVHPGEVWSLSAGALDLEPLELALDDGR
jgi:2-oxo-3-hexenedioate decarboxylase